MSGESGESSPAGALQSPHQLTEQSWVDATSAYLQAGVCLNTPLFHSGIPMSEDTIDSGCSTHIDEMLYYVVVLLREVSEDEWKMMSEDSRERGDACLDANLRAGKGPTLFLAVKNLRGPLRLVRHRLVGEMCSGKVISSGESESEPV
ncbi:hypothetical protein Tco_0877302 [Tanacetum coccineum]|uniref:Uncharacterized protein n=1 Tax=Tanacetum coccineum TaxID=301880 RepID=A0ABQ5BUY8_9ASTR